MLHTTRALSAESRITSYSISLKPAIERSIKHWVTGDNFKPFSAISRNSSSLAHIPPPVPPRVKAGRTMTGYPIVAAKATASSTVLTISDSGMGCSNSSINCLKRSRSSAWSIADNLVPRSSTPSSSRIPFLDNSMAILRPVCPPRVGSKASGRSLRRIRVTNSSVIGSM